MIKFYCELFTCAKATESPPFALFTAAFFVLKALNPLGLAEFRRLRAVADSTAHVAVCISRIRLRAI